MIARQATTADAPLLAGLNYQLIQDQQHRNPMTVPELAARMHGWLEQREYVAVIFEHEGEAVAYALYRDQVDAL